MASLLKKGGGGYASISAAQVLRHTSIKFATS